MNDGGSGVSNTHMTVRWLSYGFASGTNIPFHPNNPIELNNVIASMLAYLFLLPDSFVNIKKPTGDFDAHFILADLFSLFGLDYVQANTLSDNFFSGTFMWNQDTGGLNIDNFNNIRNSFTGIFDHRDQHHFLAFDESFAVILSIIEGFFRSEIDTNIRIINLLR